MRIGLDANPLCVRKGGVGHYADCLIRALTKVAPEHQYVLYHQGEWTGPEAALGEHVSDVRYWKPLLRWRIRRDHVDLYHGTNYKLPVRGLRGGVVTVHDLALERHPEWSPSPWRQRSRERRTMRTLARADRIITVSHHSASDIAAYYGIPIEKITVVYNGISDAFRPGVDPVQRAGILDRYRIRKKGYLLFVGTLEPRKNLPTLLRAYAGRSTVRKEFQLILAGGWGWQTSEIRDVLAELDLTGDVTITGYLAPESLMDLYRQAAAFVYPSFYEGFGFPPLEAMASGVPVVTSNTSCFPEVLGPAAVMVDPRDVEALGAAIERVLGDEHLREDLRNKGIALAKRFTWEETARRTVDVYRRVYEGAL